MPLTDLLPAGFYAVDAERVAEFERATRSTEVAWSVTTIDGDAREATCHWRTNDNRDYGSPSEYADDTWHERPGPFGDAIAKALRHSGGGARYGIGQVVLVYVNGVMVEGPRL